VQQQLKLKPIMETLCIKTDVKVLNSNLLILCQRAET